MSKKTPMTLTQYIFQEYHNDPYTSICEVEDDLQILLKSNIHAGDCTHENYTCTLCLLEIFLKEYYKYCKECQLKSKT